MKKLAALLALLLLIVIAGVLSGQAQNNVMQAGLITGDCSVSSALAITCTKVNGITISGTPAVGNVPVATSTSAAAWGTESLQLLSNGAVALPYGATMPVVGTPEKANDTFVEQIVASAKAAPARTWPCGLRAATRRTIVSCSPIHGGRRPTPR